MSHNAGQYPDRRSFLQSSAVLLGLTATGALATAASTASLQPAAATEGNWPGFPQQDPALVKEMVGASHGNVARVKELIAAHPELAKANYDWGFGDWESALGAASHVGNKEIAAILLLHGARLDIFAATMLGMNDVALAILKAQPALAKTRGPHGISLVAHANAGKNEELAAALKAIEGADDDPVKPITAEEMKTYLGVFARDAGGMININQTKFGMAIKGGAGPDRTLIRTGEHTFHPIGAPNVRISFTVKDGVAGRVEVSEDAWFVSAVRQP